MCIGAPMQVQESHTYFAICADANGQPQRIDTALVGQQPAGTWLLVFLGAAREVLDADTAASMGDALDALSAVMAGETHVDHLFPDLVDREPKLPEHLRHLVKS